MAAALAEGESVLINAAREPEIVDLATLPQRDGRADRGHRQRPADGPRRRRACTARAHTVIPDRIETGTYLMAAAATGGEVQLGRRAARSCRGGGARVLEAADVAIARGRWRHPGAAPQRPASTAST